MFQVSHKTDLKKAANVTMNCAACGHNGVFIGKQDLPDLAWEGAPFEYWSAGVRMCPNPDCRTVTFVVARNGNLIDRYPREKLGFDSTNLPENIRKSMEEAVTCHASGAYRASALMIRRTLEELCEQQGITKGNLKDKLSALGGSVIVPKELLDAADELRLLGNDAAHVEAKSYDDLGEAEANLAIELAKELLKAVYQYASLVGRLRALKRTPENASEG